MSRTELKSVIESHIENLKIITQERVFKADLFDELALHFKVLSKAIKEDPSYGDQLLEYCKTYVDYVISYSCFEESITEADSKANMFKYVSALNVLCDLECLKTQLLVNFMGIVMENVTNPSVSETCVLELLRFLNNIARNCTETVCEKVGRDFNFAIYAIVDTLNVCESYEYQTTALETIFLLCSKRIADMSSSMFPGKKSLQAAITAFDIGEFKKSSRHFLTILNIIYGHIFSIVADSVLFERCSDVISELQVFDRHPLWVDFNKKSLGIYCGNRNFFENSLILETVEIEDPELVTVFYSSISMINSIRLISDQMLFRFNLNGQLHIKCVSSTVITEFKVLCLTFTSAKDIRKMNEEIIPFINRFKTTEDIENSPGCSEDNQFEHSSDSPVTLFSTKTSAVASLHNLFDVEHIPKKRIQEAEGKSVPSLFSQSSKTSNFYENDSYYRLGSSGSKNDASIASSIHNPSIVRNKSIAEKQDNLGVEIASVQSAVASLHNLFHIEHILNQHIKKTEEKSFSSLSDSSKASNVLENDSYYRLGSSGSKNDASIASSIHNPTIVRNKSIAEKQNNPAVEIASLESAVASLHNLFDVEHILKKHIKKTEEKLFSSLSDSSKASNVHENKSIAECRFAGNKEGNFEQEISKNVTNKIAKKSSNKLLNKDNEDSDNNRYIFDDKTGENQEREIIEFKGLVVEGIVDKDLNQNSINTQQNENNSNTESEVNLIFKDFKEIEDTDNTKKINKSKNLKGKTYRLLEEDFYAENDKTREIIKVSVGKEIIVKDLAQSKLVSQQQETNLKLINNSQEQIQTYLDDDISSQRAQKTELKAIPLIEPFSEHNKVTAKSYSETAEKKNKYIKNLTPIEERKENSSSCNRLAELKESDKKQSRKSKKLKESNRTPGKILDHEVKKSQDRITTLTDEGVVDKDLYRNRAHSKHEINLNTGGAVDLNFQKDIKETDKTLKSSESKKLGKSAHRTFHEISDSGVDKTPEICEVSIDKQIEDTVIDLNFQTDVKQTCQIKKLNKSKRIKQETYPECKKVFDLIEESQKPIKIPLENDISSPRARSVKLKAMTLIESLFRENNEVTHEINSKTAKEKTNCHETPILEKETKTSTSSNVLILDHQILTEKMPTKEIVNMLKHSAIPFEVETNIKTQEDDTNIENNGLNLTQELERITGVKLSEEKGQNEEIRSLNLSQLSSVSTILGENSTEFESPRKRKNAAIFAKNDESIQFEIDSCKVTSTPIPKDEKNVVNRKHEIVSSDFDWTPSEIKKKKQKRTKIKEENLIELNEEKFASVKESGICVNQYVSMFLSHLYSIPDAPVSRKLNKSEAIVDQSKAVPNSMPNNPVLRRKRKLYDGSVVQVPSFKEKKIKGIQFSKKLQVNEDNCEVDFKPIPPNVKEMEIENVSNEKQDTLNKTQTELIRQSGSSCDLFESFYKEEVDDQPKQKVMLSPFVPHDKKPNKSEMHDHPAFKNTEKQISPKVVVDLQKSTYEKYVSSSMKRKLHNVTSTIEKTAAQEDIHTNISTLEEPILQTKVSPQRQSNISIQVNTEHPLTHSELGVRNIEIAKNFKPPKVCKQMKNKQLKDTSGRVKTGRITKRKGSKKEKKQKQFSSIPFDINNIREFLQFCENRRKKLNQKYPNELNNNTVTLNRGRGRMYLSLKLSKWQGSNLSLMERQYEDYLDSMLEKIADLNSILDFVNFPKWQKCKSAMSQFKVEIEKCKNV